MVRTMQKAQEMSESRLKHCDDEKRVLTEDLARSREETKQMKYELDK